ncbi:ATP-dependent DNA helicase RecG [Thermanaerovibrio velox]|uniref:ATP-dependent DNA helicase RecG n=1 Tax=Thermanaerovibrio velox TaxID=108007 RepID=UPI001FDFAA42|nr:DEAD/DEAH box helicase [Thermanaerovibrio velox]
MGPKRSRALNEGGVLTVRDALFLLPRRYEDLRRPLDPCEALPRRRCLVRGTVGPLSMTRGPKEGIRFSLVSPRGSISVFCFHVKRLPFREGDQVMLLGPVGEFNQRPVMVNPKLVPPGSPELGRIAPVYPSSKALPSWFLKGLIRELLEILERSPIEDPLPGPVREMRSLMGFNQALREIHWPSSEASWAAARRRLVYHELFFLQAAFALRRHNRSLRGGRGTLQTSPPAAGRFPPDPVGSYSRNLPFRPTPSQEDCMVRILRAFESGPFDLLLQGDVGSGKTAVALFAGYLCLMRGRSALFISPTEILAKQTFKVASSVLKGFDVHLVTSSERTLEGDGLPLDRPALLVGTTALLHLKGLESLGHRLVIVDEQQRFGVAQRAVLARGGDVSLLMVSATPIPRTMALGLYGDLDVVTLESPPPGRGEVRTAALPAEGLMDALRAVERDLRSGGKAFWVCPAVSCGPASAEERFGWLKRRIPWASPAMVHGRMSPAEKDAAVTSFREGRSSLLVGTTVLEVGIDVPDATVMVVEGADMMGLSQLHQLRGRVGRGNRDGLCVLLCSSREVPERIRALERVRSGFEVAELDLRERGSGTFHSTAQHGDPGLRVADLRRDLGLLEMAREDARGWVVRGDVEGLLEELEGLFPGFIGLIDGG